MEKKCEFCLGTGRALDNKHVGKSLREARKAAGIQLTAMGRYMGITKSSLSHLEHGRRHWTTTHFDKFNEGLELLESNNHEKSTNQS